METCTKKLNGTPRINTIIDKNGTLRMNTIIDKNGTLRMNTIIDKNGNNLTGEAEMIDVKITVYGYMQIQMQIVLSRSFK